MVAGAPAERTGEWLDASTFIRDPRPIPGPHPEVNTTLGVVATDAPLRRGELARVVRVVATALACRIDPVNTPFDGDTVFALSTSREVVDLTAADALGVALRNVLEEAITRAVRRS